ncbi:uncharacterized protein RJT21DRAFT_132507 [Scheffersomyces amazonensis]|uniref:uncharacterized protein n=1 Tax=Scheffersomyces amazonensis TaxID=1078765 RepID=UPI00315C8B6E
MSNSKEIVDSVKDVPIWEEYYEAKHEKRDEVVITQCRPGEMKLLRKLKEIRKYICQYIINRLIQLQNLIKTYRIDFIIVLLFVTCSIVYAEKDYLPHFVGLMTLMLFLCRVVDIILYFTGNNQNHI